MSDEIIARDVAERLIAILRSATHQIHDAIQLAREECPPSVAAPLKRSLAEAMATIGWDTLEQQVYIHHPDLRPYKLDVDRS